MTASISYINLSWAVVGIIDRDVHNSLQSMKRPDEPIERTWTEENGGIRHLTSPCSYFAEVLHRLPKSASYWLRYPRPQLCFLRVVSRIVFSCET